MLTGVRLTLSWLTVLPVRGPATVDRSDAAQAIGWAPIAGVLLGAIAGGALWALDLAGAAAPLAGLMVVALLALLTRGMHLDGLADTMDGLGTYGPPERARAVMKSGDAGPFGVAAIVFAVGIQAFAFAALVTDRHWFAAGFAVALGRVAVVPACRVGIRPAPNSGFGTLVASTQGLLTVLGWPVVALLVAVRAVPDNVWLGPATVAVVLVLSVLLVAHCVRRFDGLSGDVLGAVSEISVALCAAGLSLAG